MYVRFKQDYCEGIYNATKGQLIEMTDNRLAVDLVTQGVVVEVGREQAISEWTGAERATDSTAMKAAAKPGANRGINANIKSGGGSLFE